MARAKLGPLVDDLRGAIGNTVFSVWKGVHVVRKKSSVVKNPISAAQGAVRARIAASARRWFSVLDDAQRAEWEQFAAEQGSSQGSDSQAGGGTLVVIPVNRGVMSGFNAYSLINVLGFTAGLSAIGVFFDDAPLGLKKPDPPNAISVSSSVNQIVVDFTDPMKAFTGSRIRVWIRSIEAKIHAQQATNVALLVATAVLTTVNAANGAAIPVPAGQYSVQLDTVGTEKTALSALRSPPSESVKITVPLV